MKDEQREQRRGWPRGDLGERLKVFALDAIDLFRRLPHSFESQMIGKQFLRSATSVGAHYREARRGRSDAEFVTKIEVGIQELDEATYWLELLVAAGIVAHSATARLEGEADQLTAVLVSMVRKVKMRASAAS